MNNLFGIKSLLFLFALSIVGAIAILIIPGSQALAAIWFGGCAGLFGTKLYFAARG